MSDDAVHGTTHGDYRVAYTDKGPLMAWLLYRGEPLAWTGCGNADATDARRMGTYFGRVAMADRLRRIAEGVEEDEG